MHGKKVHIQTALTQMRRHKTLLLIRVCALCQDKHSLGNGRLKNVYDQALVHFALIGDRSSMGKYQYHDKFCQD